MDGKPQTLLGTEFAGPTKRTCQVAAAKSAVAAKSDAEERAAPRLWSDIPIKRGPEGGSVACAETTKSEHYVIISLFLMFRYVLRDNPARLLKYAIDDGGARTASSRPMSRSIWSSLQVSSWRATCD